MKRNLKEWLDKTVGNQAYVRIAAPGGAMLAEGKLGELVQRRTGIR